MDKITAGPFSATPHASARSEANEIDGFRDDVLQGLSGKRKSIPCKYLYDARGADFFGRICELDEYYPTRTEVSLLHRHRADIADLFDDSACLVEFGSGSTVKATIVLCALKNPASYVPVDISPSQLTNSANAVAEAVPRIRVVPVRADFTAPFSLPKSVMGMSRIGFFPGSTIGNFARSEAERFLSRAAKVLGEGSALIAGVDLEKDERILNVAYNDSAGITAAFNLNLLTRINRELGADFDVNSFAHDASYNFSEARIEMHLISRRSQIATVAGQPIAFGEGERIHTENSHKYSVERFRDLSRAAGWHPTCVWVDDAKLFSIHVLHADRS